MLKIAEPELDELKNEQNSGNSLIPKIRVQTKGENIIIN
jgi:hypothetical protein